MSRAALTHPVDGRFGAFGGQYVPETLMSALGELEDMWHEAKADPQFQLELAGHRRAFIGRPTPIYAATRLSEHFGGTHIHFKREDLCHTGAHKLNNAVARRCWPCAWARSGSSPRPARGSTEWQRRRCARGSGSSAPSTWAPRTCAGSR